MEAAIDLLAQLRLLDGDAAGTASDVDATPQIEMVESAHQTVSELRDTLKQDLIKSLEVAVRQSVAKAPVVGHASHPLVRLAGAAAARAIAPETDFEYPPPLDLVVVSKQFDDAVALVYSSENPPCVNWATKTCECLELGSPFPLNSLEHPGFKDARCLLCVRRDFAVQWWACFVRGEKIAARQPFRSIVGPGEYGVHATFEIGAGAFAGVSDPFVHHARCRLVVNVARRRVEQIGVDWISRVNTPEHGFYYDAEWSAELDAFSAMRSSVARPVSASALVGFQKTIDECPDPEFATRELAIFLQSDADERGTRSALVRALPRALALHRPAPARTVAALVRDVCVLKKGGDVVVASKSQARFVARCLTHFLGDTETDVVSVLGNQASMAEFCVKLPNLTRAAIIFTVDRHERETPIGCSGGSGVAAAFRAGSWTAAETEASASFATDAPVKKGKRKDAAAAAPRLDATLIRMPPHWRSEFPDRKSLDRDVLVCPDCFQIKCVVVSDPRPKKLVVKRKEVDVPWWSAFSKRCFKSCVASTDVTYDFVAREFRCYKKAPSSSRKHRDAASVVARVEARLASPGFVEGELPLDGMNEPKECLSACARVRLHGFLLETPAGLTALCWKCGAACELDCFNPLTKGAPICGSCDAWVVSEATRNQHTQCCRCGETTKKESAEFFDVFRYGENGDECRRVALCSRCAARFRVPKAVMHNWKLLKETMI